MKKLLLTGLIALGLFTVGCSDDDTVNNGGDPAAKYDTYLTLNIATPADVATPADAAKTKTIGGTTNDTDGSDISSLHVYLVNDQNIIEYSAALGSITGIQAKLQVPTGSYRVFVVANPNDKTPLRNSGNIQLVIDEVTEAQAKTGYEKGKFMMATAAIVVDDQGNLTTDATNISQMGSEVTIAATNTEADPAKANVYVDRAAVKIVSVTKAGDLKDKLNNELKTITVKGETESFFQKVELKGFVLINGNEKFNLFQKMEKIDDVNVKGIVANTPQGTEINHPDGFGKLMTGYYNPITNYGKVIEDATGKQELIDLTLGEKDVFGFENVFTIENRPEFRYNEVLTAGMASTTGIIYHTVVNDGQTFFVVKGEVYRELDVVKALPEFAKPDGTAGSILDGLENDIPKMRAKGVDVYEKGNMYYTYYIKDKNYKVEYKNTADTEFYNVLRNSVYKLTINSINNIGEQIPGGGEVTPGNPDPDIDPDKTFLEVTVAINPWVLNDIPVDL